MVCAVKIIRSFWFANNCHQKNAGGTLPCDPPAPICFSVDYFTITFATLTPVFTIYTPCATAAST